MAIALVHQTEQNNASGHSADTITIPATTAGNLLVVLIWQAAGGTAINYSLLDDALPWAINRAQTVAGGDPPADFQSGANTEVSIAYLLNCPGGMTSVTVQWAASSKTNSVSITEWSGVDLVHAEDSHNNGGGSVSGTAQVATTLATTAANVLVISATTIPAGTLTFNAAGSTPTTGWIELTRGTMGGVTGGAAYNIGVAGAFAAAWTLGTAGKSGMAQIAFGADVGNVPAAALVSERLAKAARPLPMIQGPDTDQIMRMQGPK